MAPTINSWNSNNPAEVAKGGTGSNSFTIYGPVVAASTTTGALTSIAAGSTNQVLQSGGAAANPAWSTATYPSTATSTGTILRADGTNWSATTTTYPNTNAINTLLYASSANVMSALATANTAVLATNGSGVPSITAFPQISGIGIGASAGSTAGITFDGSNFMNAYTANGTFTPTIVGGTVTGTTTYNVQQGYYSIIGGVLFFNILINISGMTGTGNTVIGGLPQTIKNQSNYTTRFIAVINGSGFTWPASTTMCGGQGIVNTTTMNLVGWGNGVALSIIQCSNAAAVFGIQGSYVF